MTGRSWKGGVARAAMALLCAACLAVAALAQMTEAVDVRGAVKTPLRLNVDDLRRFPPESLATVTLPKRDDAGGTGGVGGGAGSAVRGVRLTALLDKAAFAGSGRNDWKRTVVVLTASDGYRVVFSWPELFNTAGGAEVLVAFERDGQPLGDDEGRIAVVTGSDRRSGPRHVKWLQTVDVRMLGD